jgi:hypothetical protein
MERSVLRATDGVAPCDPGELDDMLRARSAFGLFRLPMCVLVLATSGCTVTLETIPHDVTRSEASTTGDGTMNSDAVDDSMAIDAPEAGDAAMDDDIAPDVIVAPDADGADATDALGSDATDAVICVPEVCNGLDDDCDGVIDDDIAPQVCGTGSCARIVSGCQSGSVPSCTPGPATPEVCNGLDDDCDGSVDDIPPPPPCGLGACRSPIASTCGGIGSRCVGGGTGPETCGNGIDDNCNGSVDEGCGCAAYVRYGAAPTNSGLTPTAPAPSIGAAIRTLALAGMRGNVCVGAVASGTTCSATTYNESFSMSEGISVFGGYNGMSWTRNPSACQTIIQNQVGNGIVFGHGLTRATQLDGFTIYATGNATFGSSTTAITIQEGGIIANNSIFAAAGNPSSAIVAIAPGAVADTPLIVNNVIGAPDMSSPPAVARGIMVNNLAVEIRNNTIDSGHAAMDTAGIELRDAHGSIVADNSAIRAAAGSRSVGILVTGAAGGIVIARNAVVRGGLTSGPSAGFVSGSMGIYVVGCTEPGPRVMDNGLVTSFTPPPGTSFANASETAGIRVESCDTTIETNTVVSGSATTTSVAGSGAFGIRCTGSGTRCVIAGNSTINGTIPSGAASRRTAGISVDNGALAIIDHNRNVFGSVISGVTVANGIYLDSADDNSLVEGNSVETNIGAMYASSIFAANTRARIWNNLVRVDGSTGIAIGTYGHARSPSVHSNTVVSAIGATRTYLLATDNDMAAGTLPAGTFANNVAVCLGSGSATTAFFSSGARPAEFTNNDLYGCTALYADASGTVLTDIAMINALSTAGSTFAGNTAGDPRITSAVDPHLTSGSAAVDLGTAAAAPPRDIDGTPRPQGTGYDIGCDEVSGP